MKIYMAFDSPQYYPSAGAGDFLAAADSPEALEAKIEEHKRAMGPAKAKWLVYETFDTELMRFK